MSFCRNCGSPVPDGSKFCPACGTSTDMQADSFQPDTTDTSSPVNPVPQSEPMPQPEPTPFSYDPYNTYQTSNTYGYTPSTPSYQPAKKGGNKLLLILILAIAGIAAVILILIFQMGILGRKSSSAAYEKPVQMLLKAFETQDAQLMVDILPDDIVDLQLQYYDSEEELADDLAYYVFSEFEGYDFIKISYEITDSERLDTDELDDLIDDYSYDFDVDLDITDAYNLEVDLDLQADGERDSEFLPLTVIKVDGNWYLDLYSL